MAHLVMHASILARRKSLGFTQADLARLAHTTQQHISLIERGVHQPNLSTLRRLFDALGLELTGQPDSAGLAVKLAGLGRFNAWESAQPSSMDPDDAFRQAGALARLQKSWGAPPSEEDWQARARDWALWRGRLPRRLR
ncbi:MAG: helix-turn-helix transcriptional regulator [Elusimicrobiota bacterium]